MRSGTAQRLTDGGCFCYERNRWQEVVELIYREGAKTRRRKNKGERSGSQDARSSMGAQLCENRRNLWIKISFCSSRLRGERDRRAWLPQPQEPRPECGGGGEEQAQFGHVGDDGDNTLLHTVLQQNRSPARRSAA